MMRFLSDRVKIFFISTLLMLSACVEPYPPPSAIANTDYLVVDGFLNASTKSVTVKLSHSVPLGEGIAGTPEPGAKMFIVNESDEETLLNEVDKGVYQADDLTLDATKNYKLRFTTSAGKSYSSDYVMLRQSPDLDSVSIKVDRTGEKPGIRFFVNGHDPQNQTRYYRYSYDETWEYRVTYVSDWKRDGNTPIFRTPSEQVYTCWRSSHSTSILTASTKRLSSDVVSMLSVNYIVAGSRQLSRMYSINIQQRAISEAEYEYWELMKKTTESLGGLFDPLPSQVTGNVHNDNDANEQVLGYFSGGFVKELRMFLPATGLPDDFQHTDPYDFTCETRFVPINHTEQIGDYVYVAQVGQPPTGWTSAPAICADCRSLGGVNEKPSYWP